MPRHLGKWKAVGFMSEANQDVLRVLQIENHVWTERNFPGQTSGQMLEGILEECGELIEGESIEKVLDAAADIMIYMASFCNHMRWHFGEVWLNRFREAAPGKSGTPGAERMLIILGRLAHHHLKAEQGIRGKAEEHNAHARDKAAQLMGIVQTYAYLKLIDLGEPHLPDLVGNVVKVWKTEVQPRDWASQRAKASTVDAE